MQQLSIMGAIFISFPEAVIISIIGILAIGKFNFFDNKKNYLKILLYAVISSVLAYFIRNRLDNEESLLLYLFISSLLFIFIIRLKFYESIFATIFGIVITLIITEIICLLSVSAITGIKMEEAYKNELILILFSIPERLVQISLILISTRFNIKILDLETAAIKRREYYIQLIVYFISISSLLFLAVIMARMLLLDHGNIINPTNSLLLRLNIYLSLFVTVILTLAIRSTHEHYKNKNILNNTEVKQNLQYISGLLQEKKYNDAQDAVNTLQMYIDKSI